MKVGDKVRIKVEWHPNGKDKYVHFNKIATVLKIDVLDMIKMSIDDFPNCNHRDYHNQFWYDKNELELVGDN